MSKSNGLHSNAVIDENLTSNNEKESASDEIGGNDGNRSFECAICLQPFTLPVEVPCGHIFCFLCIKGVCARNSRCPLCRQSIPSDYFYEPKLCSETVIASSSDKSTFDAANFDSHANEPSTSALDQGVSTHESPSKIVNQPVAIWYYEGRNGWWRYDDRTLPILEEAYAKYPRVTRVEIMISGYVYVVDFQLMVQFRKDEPNRRRRIKREISESVSVAQSMVKGIAGLKLASATAKLDNNSGDS